MELLARDAARETGINGQPAASAPIGEIRPCAVTDPNWLKGLEAHEGK